jgi:hypothetical protein
MLDAWWKTLSSRLDSGPAALHRLPETVAHVAEALWMQALEAARLRLRTEQRTSERQTTDKEQTLEVRSHVLTLREGELDSRLRDRDQRIEDLNLRLRELTGALRKEQATSESLLRRLTHPAPELLAQTRARKRTMRSSTPPAPKRREKLQRATPLRDSARRLKKGKRSTARKRK